MKRYNNCTAELKLATKTIYSLCCLLLYYTTLSGKTHTAKQQPVRERLVVWNQYSARECERPAIKNWSPDSVGIIGCDQRSFHCARVTSHCRPWLSCVCVLRLNRNFLVCAADFFLWCQKPVARHCFSTHAKLVLIFAHIYIYEIAKSNLVCQYKKLHSLCFFSPVKLSCEVLRSIC